MLAFFAGTRGCSSEKRLTALIPENNPVLITAEYPVLLYYVPRSSAQTLKIVHALNFERSLWLARIPLTQAQNRGDRSFELIVGWVRLPVGIAY